MSVRSDNVRRARPHRSARQTHRPDIAGGSPVAGSRARPRRRWDAPCLRKLASLHASRPSSPVLVRSQSGVMLPVAGERPAHAPGIVKAIVRFGRRRRSHPWQSTRLAARPVVVPSTRERRRECSRRRCFRSRRSAGARVGLTPFDPSASQESASSWGRRCSSSARSGCAVRKGRDYRGRVKRGLLVAGFRIVPRLQKPAFEAGGAPASRPTGERDQRPCCLMLGQGKQGSPSPLLAHRIDPAETPFRLGMDGAAGSSDTN
jgi:hypothetical protein